MHATEEGAGLALMTQFHNEPTMMKEALDSEDQHHWKKAFDSEIESLEEHKTWDLVPKPDR